MRDGIIRKKGEGGPKIPAPGAGASRAFLWCSGRRMALTDLDLLMGFATELRSLHLAHVTEGALGNRYENTAIRVMPMGVRFAQRSIEGRM